MIKQWNLGVNIKILLWLKWAAWGVFELPEQIRALEYWITNLRSVLVAMPPDEEAEETDVGETGVLSLE